MRGGREGVVSAELGRPSGHRGAAADVVGDGGNAAAERPPTLRQALRAHRIGGTPLTAEGHVRCEARRERRPDAADTLQPFQ